MRVFRRGMFGHVSAIVNIPSKNAQAGKDCRRFLVLVTFGRRAAKAHSAGALL
jgi:hypothetical protein